MRKSNGLISLLLGGASATVLAASAHAANINIPGGDLSVALDDYTTQTGVSLIVSDGLTLGRHTRGAKGDLTASEALTRILTGTGLVSREASGAVMIVPVNSLRQTSVQQERSDSARLASTSVAHSASVETVVVTSSKIKGDIQTVPIAITALSQEQLTSRQIAGGPDLVKEVPNLTFTKTNFSGYSIQIRGIGTQAISVTTDPAVAVALNDIPFIRNHFFEQEFFDVNQVEVLRGPQGTLYGRNATAGVVNVISAKPTDQFEAMLSADWGNYTNRRYEGMVNIPVVDDRVDIRLAGEWTKRDGYSFNTLTNSPIDGRDLWSSRLTIGFKPTSRLQTYLVWEHFQEDDDRLRSSKQLCHRDDGLTEVLGIRAVGSGAGSDGLIGEEFLSQGCKSSSLYSSDAFQVPNALALPYYGGIIGAGFGLSLAPPIASPGGSHRDPYANKTQSTNLRDIESTLNPTYRAKNDVLEFTADYKLTPDVTIASETGYNHDFLWSTEDYNRFNTEPGIFAYLPNLWGNLITPDGNFACPDGTLSVGDNNCASPAHAIPTGYFCDPQLGCSNRLVAEDLNNEHAWQLSHEFRVASNFSGPFNFSLGGNYLHYETEENYYVFFNTLTLFAAIRPGGWRPDNPDTSQPCIQRIYPDPKNPGDPGTFGCVGWVDPNPITSLDNQGHNYFLSQNPYTLNSYAGFGEAYYNISSNLKLVGGLRWTDDEKHFVDIPSEVISSGYGYPITDVVDQKWQEWTGRFTANWTPKLDFTEQTLVYGSFARGYKAGGANPPGAVLGVHDQGDIANPIHPLTFNPEFINAYEVGTKNTLLDGSLTLNGDVFYYDYKGYQISEIVDRTSINFNFDATVRGAELEAMWEPLPGLKFNFAGGYEKTRMANGSSAVDLMDRTAGKPGWIVVKPFVSQASNCVLPDYVIAYQLDPSKGANSYAITDDCGYAYSLHLDPVTGQTYTASPTGTTRHGDAIPAGAYPGFDPLAGTSGDPYAGQNTYNGMDYGPASNNGGGFDKDLSGNELPNAPHFTTSLSAEYTLPVSEDWAATLHSDFYWQSQSFARVFNDRPYDKIRGCSNVNLALILTSANGWQVMGYLKNVFDTTAITGTFLNSDDTGLTTNVFLTDPRLFGVRVTKNW